MDARLLAALVGGSPPRRLLGLRLHPFSLAHRLRLHACGSPLAEGGAYTAADVALAAIIGSHSGPPPFPPLPRPGFFLRARHWASALSPAIWTRQCAELAAWIETDHPRPIFDDPDTDTDADPADENQPPPPPDAVADSLRDPSRVLHWTLRVATTLRRHGHPDAWTLPEGAALWIYCELRRQDGADLPLHPGEEAASAVRSALTALRPPAPA